MFEKLDNIKATFREAVWKVDITKISRVRATYVRLLRVVYTVIHELADGQLSLRAMSLVYTSLLAMVPLLAVSFSVLKAFGVHNQLEQVLLNVLSPLGDEGQELTILIIEFVDNVKVGVLGSLGLGLLFYTVISMIQKVERAFNYTWRVEHPRRITERISDYVSVLIIGPVFLFTALGITAAVTGTTVFQNVAAIEPFGLGIHFITQLVPYGLVIAAFVFVYIFIPNTRVQPSAALMGVWWRAYCGRPAGGCLRRLLSGPPQFTAVYSSFAILILFMIWVYLSWLILLVGASVAFYYQNPEYLGIRDRVLRLSNRLRERVALQSVYLVASHFYHDLPGWTPEALGKRFDVPTEPLGRIFRALERAKILVETRGDPPTFVPARDFDAVRVSDVLEVVRTAEEKTQVHADRIHSEPIVEGLMERIDKAITTELGEITVKDLVMSESGSPVLPKDRGLGKITKNAE